MTGTFQQNGQQYESPDVKFNLVSSVQYITVIFLCFADRASQYNLSTLPT